MSLCYRTLRTCYGRKYLQFTKYCSSQVISVLTKMLPADRHSAMRTCVKVSPSFCSLCCPRHLRTSSFRIHQISKASTSLWISPSKTRPCSSNRELCSPVDIWQCLKTFWLFIICTWGVLFMRSDKGESQNLKKKNRFYSYKRKRRRASESNKAIEKIALKCGGKRVGNVLGCSRRQTRNCICKYERSEKTFPSG